MSFAIKVILVLLSVFVLEFYFVKKVIASIKNLFPKISKKKLKIGKWIILTIVNIYPIIAIFAWVYVFINKIGYFQPPENIFFDYFVLYPFWVGTMIIVQSTLFFLIIEILSLIIALFLKNYNEKIKRTKTFLFFIIFVVAVIYVPSRIIYDYNTVEINEIKFTKENLPKSLEGFKIVFISDIQADRYTDEKRLSNYIEKVNSTNPDLILMAGDMITSTPDFIELSANQLSKLKSKYGIYTCVGDHDNWAYRGDNERSLNEVTNALSKVNIPMINNNKLYLGVGEANIEVTFVTNTYVETISDKVLDSLSTSNGKSDLRIFLTHQPREFLLEKAIEKKYDLFLAGHTHGGQITFLFPFYNLSPTMIETPYMRGEFNFGKTLMIVTKGLGMSLAPVRYNATPEISVIKLSKNYE
ncbi:MAG: metallophosphoesterase [Ignavibacteriae bacterium]|nr:metallophosphoesterase [Ignavibacteriota bacterium]